MSAAVAGLAPTRHRVPARLATRLRSTLVTAAGRSRGLGARGLPASGRQCPALPFGSLNRCVTAAFNLERLGFVNSGDSATRPTLAGSRTASLPRAARPPPAPSGAPSPLPPAVFAVGLLSSPRPSSTFTAAPGRPPAIRHPFSPGPRPSWAGCCRVRQSGGARNRQGCCRRQAQLQRLNPVPVFPRRRPLSLGRLSRAGPGLGCLMRTAVAILGAPSPGLRVLGVGNSQARNTVQQYPSYYQLSRCRPSESA